MKHIYTTAQVGTVMVAAEEVGFHIQIVMVEFAREGPAVVDTVAAELVANL